MVPSRLSVLAFVSFHRENHYATLAISLSTVCLLRQILGIIALTPVLCYALLRNRHNNPPLLNLEKIVVAAASGDWHSALVVRYRGEDVECWL